MAAESFQRDQLRPLLARLREPAGRLTLVAGPRQTGKTTLIQQAFERTDRPTLYVPVDDPHAGAGPAPAAGVTATDMPIDLPAGRRDGDWLVRVWQRARVQARRSVHGLVLALDEIQDITDWSRLVKGLWDADRREQVPLQVILAGSSPLLMQRGLSESLAGRFETIRLAHWSYPEMAQAFGLDLDQYIYFGGYPGAADYIGDQGRWVSYVETAVIEPNIERDILAMERVDKPALLKQLFDLGTEYSGQILPYNKMLGQLHDAGNTTTLARYLELLEMAGLIAGLPMYLGRRGSPRRKSPKLNVLNTGLVSAQSGYTFAEARADRTFWGRLVESAAGAHLWNTASPWNRVRYWRDRDLEVDFVLERGRRAVAFEVKSGARRASRRGLVEFAQRFAPERTEVVGGDGIPLADFFSMPADAWFES